MLETTTTCSIQKLRMYMQQPTSYTRRPPFPHTHHLHAPPTGKDTEDSATGDLCRFRRTPKTLLPVGSAASSDDSEDSAAKNSATKDEDSDPFWWVRRWTPLEIRRQGG
ncbi:hypothetical protein NDU88_002104 [Pleurodeles waltl]|uniref:Uncharacterized protein n=1 Tax=Pleurodeles waltl TaxID=8319 RepID=A0AAV7NL32_PLEWA|nr:hypothetical protein NDU88_002104 [Pleurodeles waltl]